MNSYIDRPFPSHAATSSSAPATITEPSQHSSPTAASPASTSASSSFFSTSLYGAFGGIIRRLSSDTSGSLQRHGASSPSAPSGSLALLEQYSNNSTRMINSDDAGGINNQASRHYSFLHHGPGNSSNSNTRVDGVYKPHSISRTASPIRPPPLESLALSGFYADTPLSARLLTAAVAEEIRIMVPERLRIEDEWKLVYSLDQDGVSLATLYEKASKYSEHGSGFVLVVKDQEGGIFGAYLSEYPHPASQYFGTGECFLWRASILAPLPPPPSADIEHFATRSTTVSSVTASLHPPELLLESAPFIPRSSESAQLPALAAQQQPQLRSSQSCPTPLPPPSPSIRFSAFPYSGVNEYFIYCEAHSLSVGGGDGKYGLWLDDSLERGISSTCLTFGNQPLSDEGDKFGVLGVEVWVIGSRQ